MTTTFPKWIAAYQNLIMFVAIQNSLFTSDRYIPFLTRHFQHRRVIVRVVNAVPPYTTLSSTTLSQCYGNAAIDLIDLHNTRVTLHTFLRQATRVIDDPHCTTLFVRERMLLRSAVLPGTGSGCFRGHYGEKYARSINGRRYSSVYLFLSWIMLNERKWKCKIK